jgi:hypothetical protein
LPVKRENLSVAKISDTDNVNENLQDSPAKKIVNTPESETTTASIVDVLEEIRGGKPKLVDIFAANRAKPRYYITLSEVISGVILSHLFSFLIHCFTQRVIMLPVLNDFL